MKSTHLIILVIILIPLNIYPQLEDNIGNNFIQNFKRDIFRGDARIWDIENDSQGILYFATDRGIWEYDGVRWKNYEENLRIRALSISKDGHLYSAGLDGFGIWTRNSVGKLKYRSILDSDYLEDRFLSEFQGIAQLGDDILFQSYSSIYYFTPEDQSYFKLSAPSRFTSIFESKGRVFVEDKNQGLFEIENKELIPLENTSGVWNKVAGISVIDKNAFLVITVENGVFEWNMGSLNSKNWQINSGLKRDLVQSFSQYDSDKFIFGTAINGIYIVNSQGERIIHLDSRKGLLNNTVLSHHVDPDGNVWLGLDGGVNYIGANSKTSYLLDDVTKIGTVYSTLRKDNNFFIGSNRGLFRMNLRHNNRRPRMLEALKGQVWNIKKLDNRIWVGHHKGTYILESDSAKKIGDEPGSMNFISHPERGDIIYSGNYFGIGVFRKRKGEWEYLKTFDNFNESGRFIRFDNHKNLWVAVPSKGYFRIKLSEDGMNIDEIKKYKINQQSGNAYFTEIDNRLIFYNGNGFFQYSPQKDNFIEDEGINDLFSSITNIKNIIQLDNIIWYASKDDYGYLIRKQDTIEKVSESNNFLSQNNLEEFNNVSKIREHLYSIGIYNGLVFSRVSEKADFAEIKMPLLREVSFISSTDTINTPLISEKELKVPFKNNYLQVKLASPDIPIGNNWQFQYFLEGVTKDWIESEQLYEILVPSLKPGSYLLKIRSVGTGKMNSPHINYPFYISYPWYFKWYTILVYLIIIGVIIFFISRWYKRKVEKENHELRVHEAEKLKREQEKYEKLKLKAEKDILILKEENLKTEILEKNNELTSSTMTVINKNELLNEVKLQIKIFLENPTSKITLKNIIRKINRHLNSKDDWLSFEMNFNKTHAGFFKKLRKKHSNLTTNDFKLCAYLKLNLSSKEIASLMNISPRSVQMGRYRLRKKLNLDSDQNLEGYLHSL